MIYHVYANRQNIGDWLAARAIQSELPLRPICDLLIDEPFVEESVRQLRGASEQDLVIIGGGGLFLDYFLPFWSAFDEISRRVPFCIWGVGFCDSKEEPTRPPADLLERIIRRSRMCIVRDDLTRAALGGLDLPAPVICPSILLLDAPKAKGTSVIHAVHYGITGHTRYERMCELVRDFADRTGREYIELNHEIEPDDEKALLRQLQFYRQAECVVSTRLHGCIIGLASGCKVLAVSGDNKIDAFLHGAGIGDWVCDLSELDQVARRLHRLHEQPPVSPEFLERARRDNRSIGRQVTQIANDLNCMAGSRT